MKKKKKKEKTIGPQLFTTSNQTAINAIHFGQSRKNIRPTTLMIDYDRFQFRGTQQCYVVYI